jgi:hypothetical protein
MVSPILIVSAMPKREGCICEGCDNPGCHYGGCQGRMPTHVEAHSVNTSPARPALRCESSSHR